MIQGGASVGWKERCTWPCGGPTDERYQQSAEVSRRGPLSARDDAMINFAEEELLIDTEFSCVRDVQDGSDSSFRREEHAKLVDFRARIDRLIAGRQVQNVLIVTTLRHGTSRAISHWAHCMSELQENPSSAFCTLGNVDLRPFKELARPLSAESLYLFAGSNSSKTNWKWFRHSSMQVGILASVPAGQALTTEDLYSAKMALETLDMPSKNQGGVSSDAVVGFAECLPELHHYLLQRLHTLPKIDAHNFQAFRNEQRTPRDLQLSQDILTFVADRNFLDNELYGWARDMFPQATCDAMPPTSAKVVELRKNLIPTRDFRSSCDRKDGTSNGTRPPAVLITHHKTVRAGLRFRFYSVK